MAILVTNFLFYNFNSLSKSISKNIEIDTKSC